MTRPRALATGFPRENPFPGWRGPCEGGAIMDFSKLTQMSRAAVTDAQAMTALLFDFATRPEYRALVKKEFEGIKALFGEYQEALNRTYVLPKVPVP